MAIPSALELKQLVFCVFLLYSVICNFVQHSFLKTYSEPQWPGLLCRIVTLVVNGVGCHLAATREWEVMMLPHVLLWLHSL